MASFENIYNDIANKIKKTEIFLSEVKQENATLQQKTVRLEEENALLKEKVAELEDKLKLITITKTILKKEDKKETKKKINDLVREINNCIELLNK